MRKLSFVLGPLVALAGACGGDDDGGPAPPRVERFEPSTFVVDPGVRLRLSWQVSGASEIDITTAAGELVVGGSEQTEGATDIGPLLADTTYVLRARGPGGETGASVKVVVDYPRPVVEAFAAQPATVLEGDEARLFWEVRDAVGLEIVTDAGELVYAGEAFTSSTAFTPEASTLFTLSARGPGGTATATAAVTVVGAPPRIASFTASPEQIIAGDAAALSWHVLGAERVVLRVADGETLVDTSSAAGTFSVSPAADTAYELVAENAQGTDQAGLVVFVRALEAPKLRELRAVPAAAPVGGFVRLEWLMPGAERFRVLADGVEVAAGKNDPVEGEQGVANLIVTATRTVYRVEVDNRVGSDAGEIVGIGHRQPRVDAFTVTPLLSGAPTDVTVAWTVRHVDRLTLLRDGLPVPSFPAIGGPRDRPTVDSQGSLTARVNRAARFELVAESAAGTARFPLLVVVGRGEQEPNDTAALAEVLTGTSARVRGELTAGDVDVYRIEAPDDARVYAETFTGGAGFGACALDTTLTLTSTDGVTPLVVDEDDGVGRCSRIDPAVDPAARGLRAGFYFLEVRAATSTATGPYVLVFEARKPLCGDGQREGAEQCDDGNNADFDGCTGSCELEVFGPIVPPGGVVTQPHPGGAAYFTAAVDVTAPGSAIRGRVAAPAGGGCPTVDTALTLLDPTFAALGSKSDGGPSGPAGDCAGLAVPGDAFATNLAAGRHYVQVFSENGAAGPVEVLMDVLPPACGNGIVESRAGEQCDDGNLADGDGCSMACRLEAATVVEAEPNDAQATAFVTGLVGPGQVTIEAANDPAGDDDVFALTVPANETLTLDARTFTTAGQPTSCDSQLTDTRMYLEAAGTEVTDPMQPGALAYNDDIDNAANVWCSAFSLPLTGGAAGTTYYVRVQGWRDLATTQYFLRLTLTP